MRETLRQVFEVALESEGDDVRLSITPWITLEALLVPNPVFERLVVRMKKTDGFEQQLVEVVAEAIYTHFSKKAE